MVNRHVVMGEELLRHRVVTDCVDQLLMQPGGELPITPAHPVHAVIGDPAPVVRNFALLLQQIRHPRIVDDQREAAGGFRVDLVVDQGGDTARMHIDDVVVEPDKNRFRFRAA